MRRFEAFHNLPAGPACFVIMILAVNFRNGTPVSVRPVAARKGLAVAMTTYHPDEHVVVAHTAHSAAEALVIRGLLESAGIDSPAPGPAEPFPLNEPPDAAH